MKIREIIESVSFLILLFGALYVALLFGAVTKQAEIEERALQTELKSDYSWQDIEIIIFGEIQE